MKSIDYEEFIIKNSRETSFEETDAKSVTIPDMSLSIKDILQRAAAGQGFSSRRGEVIDDLVGLTDEQALARDVLPQGADFCEIAEFKGKVTRRVTELGEAAKKEAELVKAAMAEAEERQRKSAAAEEEVLPEA